MRAGLILLCSAALFSTAALADDKADSKSSSSVFTTLDSDNDGKVSKSEAEASQSFASSFDMLDGDSDGFVSKREFQRNTRAKPKSGY